MESIHAKYVESDTIKGSYNSDYASIELMLFFMGKIHNLVICIEILSLQQKVLSPCSITQEMYC